ncbi:hypothetical protein TNCV_350121 [Trichonephila clavipes]|nr:hypothetical protein TNCV_350121 [Trichonephila clavipes]
MKIGNNGNLVLGPFDESGVSLFMMNCQTKLRINHLTAVKSVAILERKSCITKKEKSEKTDGSGVTITETRNIEGPGGRTATAVSASESYVGDSKSGNPVAETASVALGSVSEKSGEATKTSRLG